MDQEQIEQEEDQSQVQKGSGGTWEGGFTLTGVSEGRGWTGVTDGVTEHGDGSKHKFPVTQHTVSPNPIYGF